MRIYLASRYGRRAEMQSVRLRLITAGHKVISRWLTEDHTIPAARLVEYSDLEVPPEAQSFAIKDVEDVRACDTLVLFSEPANGGSPQRGGCHVEFGLAFGLKKRLVVVGYRQNVFHMLPEVYFARNTSHLIEVLSAMP